uniref:Uncharacterized protein n=1 Tax=Ciona savignyi TaxID=51511 RepID=H2YUZ5_CIOSA
MDVLKVAFMLGFLAVCCMAKKKISLNMDPVDVKRWGLPLDSKYPESIQLNENSFKQKVLKSRDAWIVVIFKDKLHGKWWSHASHVKGSIWYGTVDIEKQEALAKMLVSLYYRYVSPMGVKARFVET